MCKIKTEDLIMNTKNKKKTGLISKDTKKSSYPYLSDKRVKEVNEIFTKFNIRPDKDQIVNNRNLKWPGVNAPIKKFSLLKYEGYTFKVSNKSTN